jgi:hypothetical protein
LIFFSSFDDKLGEFGPEKEIFFLIYIVFILDKMAVITQNE